MFTIPDKEKKEKLQEKCNEIEKTLKIVTFKMVILSTILTSEGNVGDCIDLHKVFQSATTKEDSTALLQAICEVEAMMK